MRAHPCIRPHPGRCGIYTDRSLGIRLGCKCLMGFIALRDPSLPGNCACFSILAQWCYVLMSVGVDNTMHWHCLLFELYIALLVISKPVVLEVFSLQLASVVCFSPLLVLGFCNIGGWERGLRKPSPYELHIWRFLVRSFDSFHLLPTSAFICEEISLKIQKNYFFYKHFIVSFVYDVDFSVAESK